MVCSLLATITVLLFHFAMDSWYAPLNKPFFGLPVKMLAPFHVLALVSAGFGVQVVMGNVSGNPAVDPARKLFGVWLVSHALWLLFFASFHHAVLGFGFCVIQWGVALLCIQKFYNVDPKAGRRVLFFFFMTTYWMLLNGGILSLNNL